MIDVIGEVLAERAHDPRGLKKTMLWSLAVHGLLVAGLVSIPRDWLSAKTKTDVITISLAGPPGPKTGGITPLGGRQVEQVAPEPKRQPIPVTSPRPEPAPDTTKTTKSRPKTQPMATEDPSQRLSNTGRELQKGPSRVENFAKGQGAGLSTGSTGGTASMVDDPEHFCCMDYLIQIRQLILQSWDPNQPETGTNVVKFVIHRDGTIDLPTMVVEQPSGNRLLDLASMKALQNTKKVFALPEQYKSDTLTIHLKFEYTKVP